MAIRYITFQVYEDTTVSPSTPQYGGIQGEHNATQVAFVINPNGVLANERYRYYVECIDAAGGYDRTRELYRMGGEIHTLVPLAWTQYGGISTLRLIAEEDGVTVFSADARLQFEDRGGAIEQVDGLLRTDLSDTLEACDTKATSAYTAADIATDAAMAASHAVDLCDAAVANVTAISDTLRAEIDGLEHDFSTIDRALDSILDIQRELMGGESA